MSRSHLKHRLNAVNVTELVGERDGDKLRALFSDLFVLLELEQSPSLRQESVLERLSILAEEMGNYFELRQDESPDYLSGDNN